MAKTMWLLTVLMLAACSGGSGGSGASGSSALTPSGAAAAAPAAFALQDGGSLTLNFDQSGTLVGATLADGATNAQLGPSNGTVPANGSPFAGGTTLYAYAAGQPTLALESMGKANGLSASDFGVWNSYSGGAVTGTSFYAGGQITSPASLPPQGAGISATYNGNYIANLSANTIYAGNPLAAGPFNGSVQIAANFDTQALRATFGGLLSSEISIGSTYNAATGVYTIGGNTASNFALATFTMNGAFYGSPAQRTAPPETAGTISGTIGSSPYSGSYGAKR